MGRRINIIHWLTIIALLALVAVQGYWLFNQYVYSLHQYGEELFRKTIETGAVDKSLRKELQSKEKHIISRWEMKIMQNDMTVSSSKTEWILYADVIDKNQITSTNPLSEQQLDSLCDTGNGAKRYRFDIKAPLSEYDILEALDKFKVNELSPFTATRFDSLLQAQGIEAESVKIEFADSLAWNPSKTEYTSIWNPVMEVTYPFNVLQKEQVRVTYKLGIPHVLGKMLDSLICSAILSLLLAFCLIYQMKTIFKQQRIEELRKSFIQTMIHELKKPIATLKMCISFMKNEKMMTDRVMKEDIIRSSQNELDNLSSYFSKLRDLTYGDMEEIPLNLSIFNLKSLIEECVNKQNIPTDRQINIQVHFDNNNPEIKADRMHIANILYNLLENAIKYSEEETFIHINCSTMRDSYIIEVSDNGFGIPSDECAYVFDKYFRGANIADRNIPGMGLGLCYVKLLIAAHKGKVSLESRLGTGSKFTIEIPKKQ